mmetsp:Transcript_17554/g.38270  ORF Transcript_17554/g.38270 Transcript_17554/m.38270 type:complete len:231 (-) Transcript_17554:283-975(-)
MTVADPSCELELGEESHHHHHRHHSKENNNNSNNNKNNSIRRRRRSRALPLITSMNRSPSPPPPTMSLHPSLLMIHQQTSTTKQRQQSTTTPTLPKIYETVGISRRVPTIPNWIRTTATTTTMTRTCFVITSNRTRCNSWILPYWIIPWTTWNSTINGTIYPFGITRIGKWGAMKIITTMVPTPPPPSYRLHSTHLRNERAHHRWKTTTTIITTTIPPLPNRQRPPRHRR